MSLCPTEGYREAERRKKGKWGGGARRREESSRRAEMKCSNSWNRVEIQCWGTSGFSGIGDLQFISVQLLGCVQLFATPWTATRQTSLSYRQLLELAQTHIHRVGDVIQHLISYMTLGRLFNCPFSFDLNEMWLIIVPPWYFKFECLS